MNTALIDTFRRACKPPTIFEEAEIYVSLAAQELADASKPEHERYNSAVRLLCCISAIENHLSDASRHQIYSKAGVMSKDAI
jgi:hypothetical protein